MAMNRQKFVSGEQKPVEWTEQLLKDFRIYPHGGQAKMLRVMYHVDTYFNEDKTEIRLQGYVLAKDIANSEAWVYECEVSYIDDEIILFFTKKLSKPKQ